MNTRLHVSTRTLGNMASPASCDRCLYIRLHCGDDLPFSAFPDLFSAGAYSKMVLTGYFDRNGRSIPWFARFGETEGETPVPPCSKFSVYDEATNIMLSGAPDLIFQKKDNTLLICDYAVAEFGDAKDQLLPLSIAQLNAHAYIAQRIGLGTVSTLGLVCYEPTTKTAHPEIPRLVGKDHFATRLIARLLPVQLEPGMISPLLARAREIYDMADLPQGRPGCTNCPLIDKLVTAVLGQQNDSVDGEVEISLTDIEPGEISASHAIDSPECDPGTEMLVRIVRAPLACRLIGVDAQGDVEISLNWEQLGIRLSDFNRSPISRTYFFGNFLGELVVRRNILQFVPMLCSLDDQEYTRKVASFIHRNFGISVDESKLNLTFHLSLVQSILTDDAQQVLNN